MGDREAILSALPDSSPVSRTSERAPKPDAHPEAPRPKLWEEFEERLAILGGQMLPLEALPLLLGRDSGYFADEDAADLLPKNRAKQASIWEAEVGVCIADLAIAETGTLIVSAGLGRSRMTSLAPPVNVILVPEEAIVATFAEAFDRLTPATSVLITGTSRTADIEGVLVRGVHGPRELYVVRLLK